METMGTVVLALGLVCMVPLAQMGLAVVKMVAGMIMKKITQVVEIWQRVVQGLKSIQELIQTIADHGLVLEQRLENVPTMVVAKNNKNGKSNIFIYIFIYMCMYL